MANININGPVVSQLDDLRDVDLVTTTPNVDEGLKWDGTNWVPTSLIPQAELDLKANIADVDTSAQVDAKVQAGIDSILDGVDGAYDTLKEIQTLMEADDTQTTAMLNSIALNTAKISFDTASQAEVAANTLKISADVNATNQGNTFNGANQLVQLNGTGQLPAIDGSLLTGLTSLGTTVVTDPVAPGSPVDGSLWWDSNSAKLKVYYDDGDSQAWTDAVPPTGSADTDQLPEGTTNLYYTDARADARIALVIDGAPGTLDTLNELAAAIGDDANFITTVNDSIGVNTTAIALNTTARTTYLDTFNGNDQLVQLNASGQLPALDGSNLTNVSTVANLDDLTDVTITTPQENESIIYSGGQWINGAAPSSGYGDIDGGNASSTFEISLDGGTA